MNFKCNTENRCLHLLRNYFAVGHVIAKCIKTSSLCAKKGIKNLFCFSLVLISMCVSADSCTHPQQNSYTPA